MNQTIDIPTKPETLAVNFEAIPDAVKDHAQWLMWKYDWSAARSEWVKVPYRADGHGKASSNNPATWTAFAHAEEAYKQGGFDGIGFALFPDDPFTIIDLDKCTGEAWAVDIIEGLDSYTEESPSGNGYHVVVKASKPQLMGCKSKSFHGSKVEVYDSERYMSFTGHHVASTPSTVERRQEALEDACGPLMGKPKQAPAKRTATPVSDDSELLDRMFRACKGSRELFSGNGSDDASADDMALANHLAFMTGSDADRMDRLFRQSGLIRPKWDERHRGDGATYGQMTIEKAIRDTRNAYDPSRVRATPAEPQEEAPNPEPVDIFGNLEPSPFPVDLLPGAIADFAKDQGELMGVDPGIIGMTALTVVAACTDDRIKIQPKRHDPTWTESARLWFTAVGLPSAKKSPGLKKAMGPAYAVDADWRKYSGELMAEFAKACKKAAKSKDDEAEEPKHPTLKRLIFEDVTVEKMGDLMAKCEPRGALVFRDELTGWLSSMDAYKNGGGKDRAAWLEAFNGGTLSIDRVNRGSTFVENWSACVIGGIQPSVIQEYAHTTNHDGMLQRFIILFARDATRGQDRAPNMDAKRAYEEVVKQAAELKPASSPVKLSGSAHEAKERLWDKLHSVTASHPNPFLTAALGKWEGLYARLLLTFHVVECAERGVYPTAEPVAEDTAERVASLMWRCLMPHAVRFYQELDDIEDKARAVAGLILARGWERFTVKRDLDRNLRNSRRWKPWEMDETMQRLESFGWIVAEVGKINDRGKPAAYVVNPAVHERFAKVAEDERRRRESVAEMMRDIA